MTKIGTARGTGQTSSPNQSDQSGQIAQNAKYTSPLYSSYLVDQDSCVECPI